MSEQLQEAIRRVVRGSRDEADIQAIVAALQTGQLTLVTGDGAIGVSGDATNAILVTGSNNIIAQGEVAESLQAILARFSVQPPKVSASVDELVQQIRSRFHDDIQRLHGTMPLWGIDHWVPLSDLFADVNVLEELSSSGKAELDDLWQDFTAGTHHYSSYRSLDRIGIGKEQKRVSGLKILEKNSNLMVVGKPGSGKTTYLQRIVTECNVGRIRSHQIPVLIKLRDFVDDGRSVEYCLKHYLSQHWHLTESETEHLLQQGKALILLDGLDEVAGETGRAIAKSIKQFARSFPQNQFIITCRTQSQESRFERFDYVEVADFNEEQVKAFAEHWFIAVMKDETSGLAKARSFLDQLFLESNKTIRELAITPILLSLTCAVFHRTGKFYSKRSKLYEEGLELLLEKWDKSREIERDKIYRDLSIERKQELLSYLALKKFEQPQYILFEQEELEDYIAEFLEIEKRASRAVLQSIEFQHGLLIERSRAVYSFSHLTFQEYLVARQIKNQQYNKLLQHVSEQITKFHWREVFVLLANMLDDASDLLNSMKNRIDLLLDDEKLQKFLSDRDDTASHFNPIPLEKPYRLASVRAFFNHQENLARAIDQNLSNDRDCAQELDKKLIFACELAENYYVEGCVGITFLIELENLRGRLISNLPASSTSLRTLTQQFLDVRYEDWDSFWQWWLINGEDWLGAMEDAMTCYLPLYSWNFSKQQEQLLQQYYDANKLLLDCLNSNCIVRNVTKQEIEETLLLPIAEIEKRDRKPD